RVVLEQRAAGVPVSRVAARSALSRELVDFLERDVAVVVFGLYSLAGSLFWLASRDGLLALACLALGAPAAVRNVAFARKTLRLTGRLNDQLENEVEAIADGRPAEVRGHYAALGRWRVRLSDCEAYNFGAMELFVLALLGAALARSCSLPGST